MLEYRVTTHMTIQTAHVTFVNSETGEHLEGTPMLIPLKAKIKEPWLIFKQEALAILALDKDLKHQDLRVLLYYFSVTDFENTISIPQIEVAKALTMQHSVISRACKKLVAKGILLEGAKKGRSTTYLLNAAYAWRGKVNANYYTAMEKSDDRAYLHSKECMQRRDDLKNHKVKRLQKDKSALMSASEVDPNEPLPIIEYLKQQQG